MKRLGISSLPAPSSLIVVPARMSMPLIIGNRRLMTKGFFASLSSNSFAQGGFTPLVRGKAACGFVNFIYREHGKWGQGSKER